MSTFFRTFFQLDNLLVSISTIGVIGLLYIIPQNVAFLDPLGQAIGDIDVTDIVFSQFRSDEMTRVDTNIVLVNIGYASRDEIAGILERIARYKPAVVGVDVFFKTLKSDSAADQRLANALASLPNVVMASKLAYKSDLEESAPLERSTDDTEVYDVFDTLVVSHPTFMKGAETGFTNLVIDQEAAFMTCRDIALQDFYNTTREPCLALKLVQYVNPEAARIALARTAKTEPINYHGNLESFYCIDVGQAMDSATDLSVVRGKIVIVGFLGESLGSAALEDIFFTPINKHYVGRAFPDMYGAVIHANVASMILRGRYINVMPFWLSILFGFVLLYVNVAVLTYFAEQNSVVYEMIAMAIQLGQTVTMLFLTIYVFNNYDYKLAFTPAFLGVFLVGTVHDMYEDSIKKLAIMGYNRWKKHRSEHADSDVNKDSNSKGGQSS
ncbi:MAG: CHASE2 domain-containing protein [Flavobacteriales bacterium]|nr:MAG: CHASE2 domain-containing protein [Bacteroidota bacterium]KXK35645.1 MAG: CHASE2 domain protein [Chlorobi bacterium OLB6]MBE2264791.1 CHASE2 domain-containing protein [Flavobacteriales bacterium]MBV6463808.1 hypothetical protein [Chlorobiota bacterium]MBW7853679.1 CHASE2 domain-containing protein [Candidatus Kapabacteria bacterium]MCC6332087.1 CHASE2 domain-containing protein [Ignavibacteria bacterium]